MGHHQVILVYLTCSFNFRSFHGSSKGLAKQLVIDSYLAIELMVEKTEDFSMFRTRRDAL